MVVACENTKKRSSMTLSITLPSKYHRNNQRHENKKKPITANKPNQTPKTCYERVDTSLP